MPYGRGYTGGSELGDLLSGFLGGYRAGDEMRAQRAAEALAREREARYAEEAAFNREQALWQRGQAERQFAAGDAERALRGILPDTAPVDRTATVGARMGPSAEVETTPLNDTGTVTDRATVPGQFMESRYRDTGTGYVIDRSIADPQVVAQRQRFEGDQRAAQANRAIGKLLGPDAGDLTGFVGTDVTPDAVLKLGAANRAQVEQGRERDAALAGWRSLAARYGIDGGDLTADQLKGEVEHRQAIRERSTRPAATPQLIETATGWMEYTPGVGMKPVTAPEGMALPPTPEGKPLPANQVEKLIGINETLGQVTEALDFLEGGRAEGPEADQIRGGFNRAYRALPGWGANIVNPSGMDARARVAAPIAKIRNMLAGAALTPLEYRSLAPFLPDPTGDSYEDVMRKLPALKDNLSAIMRARAGGLRGLGYAVPDAFASGVGSSGQVTGATPPANPTLSDLLDQY